MDQSHRCIFLFLGMALSVLITVNCVNNSSDTDGTESETLIGTWDLTELIVNSVLVNDTLITGVDTVEGTMVLAAGSPDSFYTSSIMIKHTFIYGPVQIPIDSTLASVGTWSCTVDTLTLTDTLNSALIMPYELEKKNLVASAEIVMQNIPVTLIQTWHKQ